MIRRQGDYLIADQPYSPPSDSKLQNEDKQPQIFYGEGSIKQRLDLISKQIAALKLQKQARMKYHTNEQEFFEKARQYKHQPKQSVQIHIRTPEALFQLISRVDELQNKIGKAELYSQIVHKKGNLVERVKALQMKLNRLSELPQQTVIRNIQNYCTYTEDRDQQFKYLFLYEQFMKTQGLKEQYRTIKAYLLGLKALQEQGTSIPVSLVKLTTMHNDILKKMEEEQSQLHKTYSLLSENFNAITKELDSLQKA